MQTFFPAITLVHRSFQQPTNYRHTSHCVRLKKLRPHLDAIKIIANQLNHRSHVVQSIGYKFFAGSNGIPRGRWDYYVAFPIRRGQARGTDANVVVESGRSIYEADRRGVHELRAIKLVCGTNRREAREKGSSEAGKGISHLGQE